jgi:hypothetical protein
VTSRLCSQPPSAAKWWLSLGFTIQVYLVHLNKHNPSLGLSLVMENPTQPTALRFSCLLLTFSGMKFAGSAAV